MKQTLQTNKKNYLKDNNNKAQNFYTSKIEDIFDNYFSKVIKMLIIIR